MASPVLLNNPCHIVRYDLELEPDLKSHTFNGVVRITMDVTAATSALKLHAKQLAISTASYASEGEGAQPQPCAVTMDDEASVAAFTLARPAGVGRGVLAVAFSGLLNDDMAGFARCTAITAGGKPSPMASTQFEPAAARRAFPCVDEPAAKAVFRVAITVPTHLTVLSNMPEADVAELPSGLKRVTFQDTPRMSTYLVAFAVGEFDYVEGFTPRGVRVRVYTPPGRADQGLFALDCGCRALSFYEDYFGIPFPLPKLDMMSVPEFAAGAMENWYGSPLTCMLLAVSLFMSRLLLA